MLTLMLFVLVIAFLVLPATGQLCANECIATRQTALGPEECRKSNDWECVCHSGEFRKSIESCLDTFCIEGWGPPAYNTATVDICTKDAGDILEFNKEKAIIAITVSMVNEPPPKPSPPSISSPALPSSSPSSPPQPTPPHPPPPPPLPPPPPPSPKTTTTTTTITTQLPSLPRRPPSAASTTLSHSSTTTDIPPPRRPASPFSTILPQTSSTITGIAPPPSSPPSESSSPPPGSQPNPSSPPTPPPPSLSSLPLPQGDTASYSNIITPPAPPSQSFQVLSTSDLISTGPSSSIASTKEKSQTPSPTRSESPVETNTHDHALPRVGVEVDSGARITGVAWGYLVLGVVYFFHGQ